jgi:anti-sigma regulatory factor (Ser/Thr protein kinase)
LLIEKKTTLSPTASSVGAARRFVRDVLTTRQVGDKIVDTVELLTSEVVTNAIVHAGAGPALVVRLGRGRVRVEVHDTISSVPLRLVADPYSPSGRGMAIVEELAGDWGVDHIPEGKRVWFEVPVTAHRRVSWGRY